MNQEPYNAFSTNNKSKSGLNKQEVTRAAFKLATSRKGTFVISKVTPLHFYKIYCTSSFSRNSINLSSCCSRGWEAVRLRYRSREARRFSTKSMELDSSAVLDIFTLVIPKRRIRRRMIASGFSGFFVSLKEQENCCLYNAGSLFLTGDVIYVIFASGIKNIMYFNPHTDVC